MKQLNKVVEVLKVVDLTETDFLDRETALIKVHTKPEHRDEAIRIADIFRAKIVDSSPTTYTIEITDTEDAALTAFVERENANAPSTGQQPYADNQAYITAAAQRMLIDPLSAMYVETFVASFSRLAPGATRAQLLAAAAALVDEP